MIPAALLAFTLTASLPFPVFTVSMNGDFTTADTLYTVEQVYASDRPVWADISPDMQQPGPGQVLVLIWCHDGTTTGIPALEASDSTAVKASKRTWCGRIFSWEAR